MFQFSMVLLSISFSYWCYYVKHNLSTVFKRYDKVNLMFVVEAIYEFLQIQIAGLLSLFLFFSYPVGQCFSHTPMYFVTPFIVFSGAPIYFSHSSQSIGKLNTFCFSSIPQYIDLHFPMQHCLGVSLNIKFYVMKY